MRVKVTLACSECKQRNYNTTKNKKNNPDRIELNKYCKFCKIVLFEGCECRWQLKKAKQLRKNLV